MNEELGSARCLTWAHSRNPCGRKRELTLTSYSLINVLSHTHRCMHTCWRESARGRAAGLEREGRVLKEPRSIPSVARKSRCRAAKPTPHLGGHKAIHPGSTPIHVKEINLKNTKTKKPYKFSNPDGYGGSYLLSQQLGS